MTFTLLFPISLNHLRFKFNIFVYARFLAGLTTLLSHCKDAVLHFKYKMDVYFGKIPYFTIKYKNLPILSDLKTKEMCPIL